MSSSNCCFLTCILSQEAGQVVWYSHLFQTFPQFIVTHRVKGFGIVNQTEIDVSLELSCFFDDPADVGNLMSGSSAFSKASLNIWKFTVHACWSLACRIRNGSCAAQELPHFQGQDQWPRGATPRPRWGAAASLCWSNCQEIPHIQGKRNPSKMVGTETTITDN